MKKLTFLLSIAATCIAGSVLSSCGCCAASSSAPALRPAPAFEPISGPAPVTYQK